VLLGACAFGSDSALFGNDDAEVIFGEGAQFTWRESEDSGREYPVTLSVGEDSRYSVTSPANEEPLNGVLFTSIDATPEEDYVVQLRLRPNEDAVLFAFMWRTADGFRFVTDPGRLVPDDNLSAADPYCRWQTMQSCTISRREDVFAVYRALIYQRFVVGGEEPESYVDLLPPEAARPQTPAKDG